MSRILSAAVALACAPLLSGCLIGTAVGLAGDVVEGGVKTTGAVVGAGVDAVHTSDEERERKERRRRERDER